MSRRKATSLMPRMKMRRMTPFEGAFHGRCLLGEEDDHVPLEASITEPLSRVALYQIL